MASRTTAAAFDSSRRVFRGRAGPTDRNLPKYQARRRKQANDRDESKDHYCHDKQVVGVVSDGHADENTIAAVTPEELDSTNNGLFDGPNDAAAQDTQDEPVLREIRHLLRRIRHVRESIQLSSWAIANPATWQQNVLNAVQNCVGEWRAILSHHNNELDENYQPLVQEAALQTFELVQMAMQSGPLAGGKPGYFKRCGGEIARVSLAFLHAVVPNTDEMVLLRFSDKQQAVVEKWRDNAAKAVDLDKSPSKSMLKKQAKATKKSKVK